MKISSKLKYTKLLGILAFGVAIGYTVCDIYKWRIQPELACKVSYLGTYSRAQVYRLSSVDNRKIYVMFTFSKESALALEYSKIGLWEESNLFLGRIDDIKPFLNSAAYGWLDGTLKKNTPDSRFVAITGVNIGDRAIPTLFGENCLL